MVLKPKARSKSASKHRREWSFDISSFDINNSKYRHQLTRRINVKLISVLAGFLLVLYVFSHIFGHRSAGAVKKHYPPEHGNYINEIEASSPLIFPHVEHASVLKEIKIRGLFILRMSGDGNNRYVLKPDDKPLSDEEIKKTTDQVLLVKRSFLDHGKLVYRKEVNSPEVVIVTLIDFDRYNTETLVKIVQNRVDFAQKHNYGIYVRWYQEFLPLLENQNLEHSYDYYKPFIMRAAMHAFPHAKYLFFMEQESLVMDLNLSLQKHILDPKTLDISVKRNSPIVPNSNIRTYQNFHAESSKIIIPQDANGNLDMSCFIVATDLYAKAFLEFLMDPLILNYAWSNFDASVGHILQWHPKFLSKTAIVVPKLFASVYNPPASADGKEVNNAEHYTEGDLVASFKGCKTRGSCVQDINELYSMIKR